MFGWFHQRFFLVGVVAGSVLDVRCSVSGEECSVVLFVGSWSSCCLVRCLARVAFVRELDMGPLEGVFLGRLGRLVRTHVGRGAS